jgi:hypothetical protein
LSLPSAAARFAWSIAANAGRPSSPSDDAPASRSSAAVYSFTASACRPVRKASLPSVLPRSSARISFSHLPHAAWSGAYLKGSVCGCVCVCVLCVWMGVCNIGNAIQPNGRVKSMIRVRDQRKNLLKKIQLKKADQSSLPDLSDRNLDPAHSPACKKTSIYTLRRSFH